MPLSLREIPISSDDQYRRVVRQIGVEERPELRSIAIACQQIKPVGNLAEAMFEPARPATIFPEQAVFRGIFKLDETVLAGISISNNHVAGKIAE